MYLLILFLPFLGFIYSALGGRFFGRAGCSFFATIFVLLSFSISIFAFYEVAMSGTIVVMSIFS